MSCNAPAQDFSSPDTKEIVMDLLSSLAHSRDQADSPQGPSPRAPSDCPPEDELQQSIPLDSQEPPEPYGQDVQLADPQSVKLINNVQQLVLFPTNV